MHYPSADLITASKTVSVKMEYYTFQVSVDHGCESDLFGTIPAPPHNPETQDDPQDTQEMYHIVCSWHYCE